MRSIFAAAFSLVSFSSLAQENREEFTLRMPYDGQQVYEQKVLSSDYFVQQSMLQIYPGEKLFLEAIVTGNEITHLSVVKEVEFPERTITIEFSQMLKDGKHESMMLKVVNPFDKKLEYKAQMFILGHDKWVDTSIMPVSPKLTGYETWSDFIITLVLKDWKLE